MYMQDTTLLGGFTMTYAIATDLKGFPTSTLRVKITREIGHGYFNVITADIRDSGTHLVLTEDQLQPCADTAETWVHKDGLVTFS